MKERLKDSTVSPSKQRSARGASSAVALPVEVCRQVASADPDRMGHPVVCKLAAFAKAVDNGGADAEELGDLADRKQGCAQVSCARIL